MTFSYIPSPPVKKYRDLVRPVIAMRPKRQPNPQPCLLPNPYPWPPTPSSIALFRLPQDRWRLAARDHPNADNGL